MPAWVARVGTPDGAVTTRTYEAADERAVRAEVSKHGGRVFSIRLAGESGGLLRPAAVLGAGLPSRRRRSVKLEEFLVFNQELVALLKAGLPIVSGLEILLERQQNPAFKRILSDVKEQLVSGVALSDAFLSHGETFPRLYATSLKAGERSGEVEKVLRRYLAYQKMIGAVRRKVVSALVYPTVLTALSVGLIVILMTYVIPRFTEFYSGFGGDMPLLTRVVVGTATFLKGNLAVVAVTTAALVALFLRWKATPAGRRSLDGLLLRIPLVGKTLHQFALSQFARALATLVGAGTPLVSALEISSGSVSNRRVAEAVEAVVPKVREGAELWRSLEATGQFTSLAVEMVKVGEATGALEEMLTNVAEFYDESIEAMLQRLINLIEPVILVVMGGVIATILLSVYLPMFTIIQNIK
ncbi:type II secretion system F family protein [Acidobacteria bacterium ACD]|nr:MAG: type II secretion system F family protein [Acidobacteriota bacterium]MDL1950632.1 type II secretion system F family protein [Acidobacteria bacterium ACD]